MSDTSNAQENQFLMFSLEDKKLLYLSLVNRKAYIQQLMTTHAVDAEIKQMQQQETAAIERLIALCNDAIK